MTRTKKILIATGALCAGLVAYAQTGLAAPAWPYNPAYTCSSTGVQTFFTNRQMHCTQAEGIVVADSQVTGDINPNNGRRVVVANLTKFQGSCAAGQVKVARIVGTNWLGLSTHPDCWTDDIASDGVTNANGNQNVACDQRDGAGNPITTHYVGFMGCK